jgi:hypothetical protein
LIPARRMTRALPLAAVAGTLLLAVAACGGQGGVDSGGLSSGDRSAVQAALNGLHGSNIPLQLVAISQNVQEPPSACRVHVTSEKPRMFHVYLFWTPWLAGEDYTWLTMTLAGKPSDDHFHLGSAHPVLPGGQLSANGRSVVPWTVDTTLLSRYGPGQIRKTHQVMLANAGDTFSKPTASCEVLTNGDLRLLPTTG